MTDTTQVLIAGAGPVGLTLAMELEHHGIKTLLVERNATTTQHPKMDITNGRSMELFRRLGVADALRDRAVTPTRELVVTWATEPMGWELASFTYPTVETQRQTIAENTDGTLPLEPAMRVSQIIIEPAMRDLLMERAEHVSVQYGWGVERFEETADGVLVHLVSLDGERRTIRTDYLVGCDGAGSTVRRQLDIGIDEIDLRKLLVRELGVRRIAKTVVRDLVRSRTKPPDGRFYLVHFTTTEPEIFTRFGPAWHLQSPDGWAIISQNDGDTFTLHAPLATGVDADAIDPKEFVYEQLGVRFDMTVLVSNYWTPRLVVANSFGRDRVWLAGDSTHQVTPTGGYGMNTGVGDAVTLGWMLAAQLQGWGGPNLLGAYEQERRPVALRNREAAARHSVVRGAIISDAHPSMHTERWQGERTRKRIGREIEDLGNLENEALGIELGYRYDASPVICHENSGSRPPRQTTDAYTPSSWPGARPPSLHLKDGTALFDLLSGRGFTLLRFDRGIDVAALVEAAAARQVPLEVVDIDDRDARRLYERDLVLIRPDQHVAWRGNALPAEPLHVVDRVRGA